MHANITCVDGGLYTNAALERVGGSLVVVSECDALPARGEGQTPPQSSVGWCLTCLVHLAPPPAEVAACPPRTRQPVRVGPFVIFYARITIRPCLSSRCRILVCDRSPRLSLLRIALRCSAFFSVSLVLASCPTSAFVAPPCPPRDCCSPFLVHEEDQARAPKSARNQQRRPAAS